MCELHNITLLNAANKIFTAIIREILTKHTETVLGDYQKGFGQEKLTTNAIHILKQNREKL